MHVKKIIADRKIIAAGDLFLVKLSSGVLLGARTTAKQKWPQARSQVKISEGAKSFTMKSTRQGSNHGEILYPKYIGCKLSAKGCNGLVVQLQRVGEQRKASVAYTKCKTGH